MATASVTYTTAAGRTGTGTLTYSVSSTNTVTTFTATKFVVTSDFTTNDYCRAVIDGDVIATILHDGGGTISHSKSWNRGTSAQTKVLKVEWYVSVNGVITIEKTTSVNITVPALASYTVSYNANGGTGTVSSQTKYYGQSLTLRSNSYTRTNYAFKCWNTSTSDPSASRYAVGASYTANAAATFYAIWNPKIAYNANGGSGAPATQTKTFNSTDTVSSTVPTRTGYTFSEWNTKANGSGTNYSPGGTIAASMNTATTLYAQWTANTYTISFNANGGVGAPSSISKTYGQSVTLPTAKPTRVGHTFLGWASSSGATTAQWLAGGTFSEAITANTTLYAVWRDDYTSPSISSLTVYRCDSQGVEDDEGTYAHIEAAWSIDTTVDESVTNSGTVTGTVTPEGGSASSITWTSGSSGTSGTAIALISGLDVDTQYTVTVTVTDVRGASKATSRTALLLRAFYIMDFGAQGNAVGIGRAAPASGLEVGYPATFDDEVNLYDELQFNGEQAFPTFTRSSWSISSDQTMLPVTPCFVLDTTSKITYWCDGSSISRVDAPVLTGVKGDAESTYRTGDVDITAADVGALPLAGGELSGHLSLKSSLIDRDGPNPSSDQYGNVVRWYDKDDELIGFIQSYRTTAGRIGLRFYARNEVSGSEEDCGFSIGVNEDGTPRVGMTTGAPAAWRSAIGAAASSHTHSIYFSSEVSRTANTVLAAPNGSAGTASFRKLVEADIPELPASKITGLGSTQNTDLGTKENVATATWTEVLGSGKSRVSIPAGTWIVVVSVSFASSATGRRVAIFTSSSTGTSYAYNATASEMVAAVNGGPTKITFTTTVSVSAATPYYLRVWQNSGSALNVSGYVRLTRIA